jgi:c-di-GMP-related signal transduction protein
VWNGLPDLAVVIFHHSADRMADQPILDGGLKVAACELLLRSSQVNACDSKDEVEATSQG